MAQVLSFVCVINFYLIVYCTSNYDFYLFIQAMKMSMMEERARMEQALKASAEEAGAEPAATETAPADAVASTEDEMLQEAIRISMMESSEPVKESSAVAESTTKDLDQNASDPYPPAKKSRSEQVSAPAPTADASALGLD